MWCPCESISIGSCSTGTAVMGPSSPGRQYQQLSPSRAIHSLVLSCLAGRPLYSGSLLKRPAFLFYRQRQLLGRNRSHITVQVLSCQPAHPAASRLAYYGRQHEPPGRAPKVLMCQAPLSTACRPAFEDQALPVTTGSTRGWAPAGGTPMFSTCQAAQPTAFCWLPAHPPG